MYGDSTSNNVYYMINSNNYELTILLRVDFNAMFVYATIISNLYPYSYTISQAKFISGG
jgi:hypothetical protein